MFPEIITPRLHLKRITENDKEQVFQGLSNDLVTQYYGVEFTSMVEVQIQMNWYEVLFAKGTGIWWGIFYHEAPQLIGACGFNSLIKQHQKAEIGFWLHPDHWGKNLMGEALPFIVDYAFSKRQSHRIEALVETENHASKVLLEKLNFMYEGTMKDCEFKKNKFISLNIYALLRH